MEPRPGSSLGLNRSGSSSESERRPAPRGQTRSTRDASDSESERHHHRQHHTPPLGHRHSTKEKRGKHRKYQSPASRFLRFIAMSGLACTLCALGVLLRRSPVQQAELAGSPLVTGSRVLHLTLAGSERKARFGVSPSLTWAEFLQGVQERLHLDRAPDKIETSAGWVIRSVSDLIHRDNVVVYPHVARRDLADLAAGADAAHAHAAHAHAAHAHAARPHTSSRELRPSSSEHPPRTAAEAAEAVEMVEAEAVEAEAVEAAVAAVAAAAVEAAAARRGRSRRCSVAR